VEWETSVEVAAPPPVVWQVHAEVEAWRSGPPRSPRSSGSTPGRCTLASAFGATNRLPKTVWRLTELVEGRSWVWEAGGPGARVVAHHEIGPAGTGTLVRLCLVQRGVFGVLVGALTSRLTRRYLAMEAGGLQRRCER
jgi:hypothetical protein